MNAAVQENLAEMPDAWITRILSEAETAPKTFYGRAVLENLRSVHEIMSADDPTRLAVLKAGLSRMRRLLEITTARDRSSEPIVWANADGSPTQARIDVRQQELLSTLTRRLAASPIIYDDASLEGLLRTSNISITEMAWFPFDVLLLEIEHRKAAGALTRGIRTELEGLRATIHGLAKNAAPESRKLVPRIDAILHGGAAMVLQPSPWATDIMAWLDTLEPKQAEPWRALFTQVAEARQAEPSERWRGKTVALLDAFGDTNAVERILLWLEQLTPDPAFPDPNTDAIKGLVWCVALRPDGRAPFALGGFAERCFRKVPGLGPRSLKLGNASLQGLAMLLDGMGVAELFRLKGKIRHASASKRIDQALRDIATRLNSTVEALEELAVPRFGFDAAGRMEQTIDGCAVVFTIVGTQTVDVTWRDGDGKSQRTPPARLKSTHDGRLKDVKRQVKEIEAALAGQAARIERLFLDWRHWPLETWRTRYGDHPLLSPLTRRLIWNFGGATSTPGLLVDDQPIDAMGKPLTLGAGTVVQLWHPSQATPDQIAAWRQRLAALDIVQPFKQAHREIYVLTDAERQTETYSNRFAGHVLRQHQFRSLCQQRDWVYDLQGAWDSHNVPTRYLRRHGLAVEFWVDTAEPRDAEKGHTGVFLHVATDQVRFIGPARRALPLADIHPLVFSEMMREVDLFVSVASVGNDPNWIDSGPERPFTDYWRDYAFGDLNATARTRHEVLRTLLPKLSIRDRCGLTARFLTVRGSRRTYKIHLGSANIMMEPNDRYLCIVPARGKAADGDSKVHLPFEGDTTLSVILSKAFLLANDQRITDPTILRQIE